MWLMELAASSTCCCITKKAVFDFCNVRSHHLHLELDVPFFGGWPPTCPSLDSRFIERKELVHLLLVSSHTQSDGRTYCKKLDDIVYKRLHKYPFSTPRCGQFCEVLSFFLQALYVKALSLRSSQLEQVEAALQLNSLIPSSHIVLSNPPEPALWPAQLLQLLVLVCAYQSAFNIQVSCKKRSVLLLHAEPSSSLQ